MKKTLDEIRRFQRIAGLLTEAPLSRRGKGRGGSDVVPQEGIPIKVVSDEDGNMDWEAPGPGYVLIRKKIDTRNTKTYAEYYSQETNRDFLVSQFNDFVDPMENLVVILHNAQDSFSSTDPEEAYLFYDNVGFGEPIFGGKWEDGRAEELSTPPNYGM